MTLSAEDSHTHTHPSSKCVARVSMRLTIVLPSETSESNELHLLTPAAVARRRAAQRSICSLFLTSSRSMSPLSLPYPELYASPAPPSPPSPRPPALPPTTLLLSVVRLASATLRSSMFSNSSPLTTTGDPGDTTATSTRRRHTVHTQHCQTGCVIRKKAKKYKNV